MMRIGLMIAVSTLFFGCETRTQTYDCDAFIGQHPLDESDRMALEAQNPRTLRKLDHEQSLDVQDIKEMSQAGIKDAVIISQIRAICCLFHLTTADIIDLKNSGVSQRVIDAMIKTGH